MKPIQVLNSFFGYDEFRPGQEEIINSILNGKNVLSVLPTGAGKSLCYQIPALLSESFSIVISPLISLMKDQVDALNSSERTAAFINSTLDRFETEKVLNEILEGKIKLLYVAPEKLNNQEFILRIKNLGPQYLFVDEAHCISEWGHNFRPSYRKIKDFAAEAGVTKISAFTATATPEVRDDIISQLSFEDPLVFVNGFERENIEINISESRDKLNDLVHYINQTDSAIIVYCSTRKNTEEAAEHLNKNNIEARYYHAGISSELRRVIQDDFQSGRINVICATNAFGMGIDKKDIRLIIHYNMPGSVENYYQEIGRAGRDGKISKSVMLVNNRDSDTHEFLINSSFPNKEIVCKVYDSLCDYIGIALSNEYDGEITVDEGFKLLVSRYNISMPLLNASLNILEDSNYIKLLPPANQRLKFLLSLTDVKKYTTSVAKVDLRDLIMAILKNHGNRVFNNFVNIDVTGLSESLGHTLSKTNRLLKQLDDIGIISFEDKRIYSVVKLTGGRIPSESLSVNFEAVKKKKEIALKKLDEMQDLVYSKDCRTKFILNYFGEETENFKCGHCDNCKSGEQKTIGSENYIEEKVLQTLHLANGSIEQKYLLRILTGTSNHQSLKAFDSFASCKLYKRPDILNVLQKMKGKKLLTEFNSIISITEKAEEKFITEIPVAKETITSKYESDLAVFNKLREVRKEAAQKFNQSQNLICPDKTLREVANVKPQTISELMAVSGFTKRMFNKFGLEAIEAIKEVAGKLELQEKKKDLPEHLLNTHSLVNKGYSLYEISSIKKLPEAVISFEIESLIEFFPDLDISKLLTKQEIKKISTIIDDNFDLPLKEIKNQLDGSISYAQIRIVVAKLNQNNKK